ncbi:MAG: hypothetical protein H7Y33_02755 [Cytophagales bacterium]|nr:hypothetical protein [Rhizobacter sp.]
MELKYASILVAAVTLSVSCWWLTGAKTASVVSDPSSIRLAHTKPRTAAIAAGQEPKAIEPVLVAPEAQAEAPVPHASALVELDVQVRLASVLPAWAAERNLHADVSAADPSASIKTIACATHFCRVDIARSGPDSPATFLDKLADQFNNGSAALFRPADGDVRDTVMYFMDTTASLQDGNASVE